MAKVNIQVKVSYYVSMEIESSNEDALNAMRQLQDSTIKCNGSVTKEEQKTTDWIDSVMDQHDAYEVEYDIEQLLIDGEEIL